MGQVYLKRALLILALGILTMSQQSFALAPEQSGYITDVEHEISNEPWEVVLIDKPEHLDGPTFNQQVFNHQLSKEFIDRYQATFGKTEQEENYFLTNRQGYIVSAGVLTPTQVDTARKEFAQYMERRLIEYHGENIMKNDPKFKAIYEIKQTISNVSIAAGPSSRFDMAYSFVGNTLNMSYQNPYVNLRGIFYMDPGSMLPTAPNDINVSAQKIILGTSNEFSFAVYSKLFRYTIYKGLVSGVTLNFTQTLPVVASLNATDTTRESLSMAGLSLSF